MPRRKPRPGRARLAILVTCCLILTPIAWASQRQEHHLDVDISDTVQRLQHTALTYEHSIGAEKGSNELEREGHEHENDEAIEPNDPSAIQTFAPARQNPGRIAVRAPIPARAPGRSEKAGLSPLHHARPLQDWDVEDLILLATVDGSIYAHDRKTGRHRWGPIQFDPPVVETIYHRENSSSGLQYQYEDSLNDFLWIVEPVQDGDIYLYNRARHGLLQRLHMTVKDLQDKTPHVSEEPAVVYVADKSTAIMNFDAATGEWRSTHSSSGSSKNGKTTCRVEGFAGFQEQECGLMGSLFLGRVTYTIHIQHRVTTEPICTLKYSEWVPNTRDGDLRMQHNSSMDHSYVYSGHDGRILSLRHTPVSDKQAPVRRQLWQQKLPSPVIRVFDVARPANSDSRDAELVVLPQPVEPMSIASGYDIGFDANRVFVNQTDHGGWYALSEQKYPMVTRGANEAPVYNYHQHPGSARSPKLPLLELEKVLVGVHPLAGIRDRPSEPPHLIDPAPYNDSDSILPEPTPPPVSPAIKSQDGYYISKSTVNAIGILSLLLVAFVTYCVFYIDRSVLIDVLRKQSAHEVELNKNRNINSQSSSPINTEFQNIADRPQHIDAEITARLHSLPSGQFEVTQKESITAPINGKNEAIVAAEEILNVSSQATLLGNEMPALEPKMMPTTKELEEPEQESANQRLSIETSPADEDETVGLTGTDKDKKKARRGTRGGKAHRRKKKEGGGDSELNNLNIDARPIAASTEIVVERALEIDRHTSQPEPDAVTVIPGGSDPTRVDDKTLQIGQLTVLEDKVLGFGSHGTRVFRGTFGGRDVAVKCMLKQLYDIASHEVTVLQESDDHPNVIRYYMMESAGDFMYIALELCPASLADIVDKPLSYQSLTGPAGLDMVDALRQITLGIRYLHSLKIVHRDIKPENILLAAPKRILARPDFSQPARLLISDFGLCKKLEVDQSSFRATTAHAAGTSGWRAPELLVDDEADTPSRADGGSGTQYSTNSEPVVIDTTTNRRVTRAIDIFALGCVFYYVLSKGGHPFDGKGRGEGKYMREANIIRGNHMLDELSVLGAYQGEATDLIGRMLAKQPKDRPDATLVLAHPFFWSAADRLDFLCHVSDQFEFEPRDPPSHELQTLEAVAPEVIEDCRGDFLKKLPADFVATLGKQRKYKGDHMLDLLRALRNKKNHYEDMPDSVKAKVGNLPEGYLLFWTERFPRLLMKCHEVVSQCGWNDRDRFRKYYQV